MAAISPPESQLRHNSPVEEVQTSGGKTDSAELEGGTDQTEENTLDQSRERQSSDHSGNNNASLPGHYKVIESGAGGGQTCNSPEPKMAESPGDEQRPLDCPGDEDNGEEDQSHTEENSKCTLTVVLDCNLLVALAFLFPTAFAQCPVVHWTVQSSVHDILPYSFFLLAL